MRELCVLRQEVQGNAPPLDTESARGPLAVSWRRPKRKRGSCSWARHSLSTQPPTLLPTSSPQNGPPEDRHLRQGQPALPGARSQRAFPDRLAFVAMSSFSAAKSRSDGGQPAPPASPPGRRRLQRPPGGPAPVRKPARTPQLHKPSPVGRARPRTEAAQPGNRK